MEVVGALSIVLALNVGSSSLKLALFRFEGGHETMLAAGEVEGVGSSDSSLTLRVGSAKKHTQAKRFADDDEAIAGAFAALQEAGLPEADRIGHRFVHGGPDHTRPAVLDDTLLRALAEATPFAPLHMPPQLAAVAIVRKRFPNLPQVACFATAFHAAMPEVAQRFALPRELFDRGLRKFGFHGLSYEYLTSVVGAKGRIVMAHLGSGASLCAVRDGRSVDTTMGLTPTGGIMMGTRAGDVDPGLLLYLLNNGYNAHSLAALLDHDSGLRGVSGTTGNMKTLLVQAEADPHAALAVEMFAYQARKTIGAFAAVLGGIDRLVFTGGIGELAAPVRAKICAGLEHLGITLDAVHNAADARRISRGPCLVEIIPTDEERMIARHAQSLANR